MSVTATVLLDVMDLSEVFCVADSGVLQDTILWNSMGMHTCSVWFSNTLYSIQRHYGQPDAKIATSIKINFTLDNIHSSQQQPLK
mgnify:CR=1 FL=1